MKSLLPVIAIVIGILFPQAGSYSFLIKPLLMFILFFPFLELKVTAFYKSTLWIIIANIALAITAYLLLLPFNSDLAFVSFITAIAPTGISAPAVASFLALDVEYVTLSTILTNSVIALTLPFLIPLLTHQANSLSPREILLSVLGLFLIPLAIAQTLKLLKPQLLKSAGKFKILSFYAWSVVLFVAGAKASHFILYESTTSLLTIAAIATVSLVICAANFGLGFLIGGKHFAKEASQSLGQKNTMLTVWVSLSFLQPVVALGPMFYILYHNLYNSYQLFKIKTQEM
jgi:BASS family bile acid:Na+ symporter